MRLTIVEPTEARFVQPRSHIWHESETLYVDEVRNHGNGTVELATLDPADAVQQDASKPPKRRFVRVPATYLIGVVPDPATTDLLGGLLADCLEQRHGARFGVWVDGVGLIEGRNVESHTAFVDLTPSGKMEIRNMRDEVVANYEPLAEPDDGDGNDDGVS